MLQVGGHLALHRNIALLISTSEPVTEILGGPGVYIEEGVTMNLTCIVKDSPEPPQFIFWYHNHQVMSKSSNFRT
jgi:neurotrimin